MFGVNMDKSLLQAFTPHLQALEIANDLYECEGKNLFKYVHKIWLSKMKLQ